MLKKYLPLNFQDDKRTEWHHSVISSIVGCIGNIQVLSTEKFLLVYIKQYNINILIAKALKYCQYGCRFSIASHHERYGIGEAYF